MEELQWIRIFSSEYFSCSIDDEHQFETAMPQKQFSDDIANLLGFGKKTKVPLSLANF